MLAAALVVSVAGTGSSARAQRPDPSVVPPRSEEASVTFNKDIAPIVFASCASCHRPGGVSFSLLTYDEVRARAGLIAAVTQSRFMPPWRPEPDYGRFAGARRLSDQQIAVMKRWIEEGRREGDVASRPPLPTWTSEWRLGEPDLVISMPESYTLRASGDDLYRAFVVPIPVSERRYVKAWEFRPGNGKVVHHATLHIDQTAASRRLDARDPEPGFEGLVANAARTPDGFFLDWAPGHTPAAAADGMAWPIDRSSDLVMMLHLRPSGRQETLRASIGLYFAHDAPSRLPVMVRLNRQDLDIPAGESGYTVTDSYTLPVSVDVYSVQPHAHYLAREVKGFAKLPDGRTEPLIFIKDWAFDWQDVYRYDGPVFLPEGTTIVMEWRYDNSQDNPRNPHRPPRRVVYGQRTSDEMSELWLQVVPRNGAARGVLTRSIRAKVLPQEIKGFEMMLRSEPDNPGLHDDAALLYREAGNLEQSAAHFSESLRLRPQSAAAHYNLGTALLALGRRETSASHFRQALAIDPDYSLAHYNLGLALHSLGELEEASAHYLEVVRLDANNADAHRNLGLLFQQQKKPDDAINHYREALRISPDWPPALLGLSWILATSSNDRLRDPIQALRLAERAATASPPRDVTVLDVLAAAYAATGQFERAVKAAETAAEAAVTSGNREIASQIQGQLKLYRNRRPYREP